MEAGSAARLVKTHNQMCHKWLKVIRKQRRHVRRVAPRELVDYVITTFTFIVHIMTFMQAPHSICWRNATKQHIFYCFIFLQLHYMVICLQIKDIISLCFWSCYFTQGSFLPQIYFLFQVHMAPLASEVIGAEPANERQLPGNCSLIQRVTSSDSHASGR